MSAVTFNYRGNKCIKTSLLPQDSSCYGWLARGMTIRAPFAIVLRSSFPAHRERAESELPDPFTAIGLIIYDGLRRHDNAKLCEIEVYTSAGLKSLPFERERDFYIFETVTVSLIRYRIFE